MTTGAEACPRAAHAPRLARPTTLPFPMRLTPSHSTIIAVFAAAMALGLVPRPVSSQEVPPAALQNERPRGGWGTLWSRRTPHDRVILGMATVHVYDFSMPVDQNNALGLVREGVLAASFITTHGPRGYVVAFERSWIEGTWGPFETMFGFRAGLVGGYDRRLGTIADRVPILPYAQPMGLLRWEAISLDLTYTWVVASLTVGVTLW